jgi:hypothetical protein
MKLDFLGATGTVTGSKSLVGDIVSCDTIRHPSNRISLVSAVAAGVRALLP